MCRSLVAALALGSCRAHAPTTSTDRPTPIVATPHDASAQRDAVSEDSASVTVVERWREQWQITANFVADLGDTLLVRTGFSPTDPRFALYDARTATRVRELTWLREIVPANELELLDRLTFARPFVAVVEGLNRERTTVRDLETGAIRWQITGEKSLWMRAIEGSPAAFTVAGSTIERRDAARGTRLWQQRSASRTVEPLDVSDVHLVALERDARSGPAWVVARSLRTGAIAWRREVNFEWESPAFIAHTCEHWWFGAGTSLWALARSDGAIARRLSTGAVINALHGLDSRALVSTVGGVVRAFSAQSDRPLWTRTDEVECVLASGDRAFVVRRHGVWTELDAATGEVVFERGGGACHYEHRAIVRGDNGSQLILTQPASVLSFAARDRRVAQTTLRIEGQLELDGAPAANVSVALATLRTTTDASGRFVFALRARGSFALRVDTRAMATASRRCVTASEPVMIEHDGSDATRVIRARYRSYAPLAPTGCSQM